MQTISFDQILAKLDMPYDLLNEIVSRQYQNSTIAEYYLRKYYDSQNVKGYKDSSYLVTSNNVKQCFKSSQTSKHDNFRLLDVKNIYMCKNKFCSNCQKMLQATRLRRMFDVISETNIDCDLYHIVLTVPNVKGCNLEITIDIVFEAFAKLIRYFKLGGKIKGIDFSQYGYRSAFRALEITYNMTQETYHPHLHCIFALRKNLNFKKQYINKYSFSGREIKTYFSDFEIFIQKLWRLIVVNTTDRKHKQTIYDNTKQKKVREDSKFRDNYNLSRDYKIGKPLSEIEMAQNNMLSFIDMDVSDVIANIFKSERKFTAKRIIKRDIDSMGINDGYSCIADLVNEDNIYEVFKYAFKTTDEDGQIMSYEVFTLLDDILKGRRMVQGYGDWYGIQLDDIDTDSVDALYYYISDILDNNESQVMCNFSAEDLLEYSKDKKYTVISRKQLFQFVKSLNEYELARYIDNFEEFLMAVKEERKNKKLEKEYIYSEQVKKSIPTVEDFERHKKYRKEIMQAKIEFAKACEMEELAKIEEQKHKHNQSQKYKQTVMHLENLATEDLDIF